MNQYQLEALQLLAEIGNLSQTADRLFISQPALSQLLKRMEEELGVPLFDRVNNRLLLNRYGKEYLVYATQALRVLREGKKKLDDMLDPDSGTVKILDSGHAILIRFFMDRLSTKWPNVKFSHHFEFGQKAVDQLIEGNADFFITLGKHSHPYITTIPLGTVSLFAAVPKVWNIPTFDGPFGQEVSLDYFLSRPTLTAPHPFDARLSLEQLCQKNGHQFTYDYESVDFGAISLLNEMGRGFSYFTFFNGEDAEPYLNELFIAEEKLGRFSMRIRAEGNLFPLNLVMLKNHYTSVSVNHFIEEMQRTLSDTSIDKRHAKQDKQEE